MTNPDPKSVDGAIHHVMSLLLKHCETYGESVVVEPLAWRDRYAELYRDLEWLEFVRDHPLP